MDFGDFGPRPPSAASDAAYEGAGGRRAERPGAGGRTAEKLGPETQQEALEVIEARCLELSTLARRSGCRHIQYLLQIAAQEAAARRAPPNRARTVANGGTESGLRLRTATEVIA